jgi:hypothetical protein
VSALNSSDSGRAQFGVLCKYTDQVGAGVVVTVHTAFGKYPV